MQYPLVRVDAARAGWSLVDFSAAAGLHPQLVRRFVTLGLLIPHRDGPSDMVFDAAQLARVARIQRLRAGLGLNYTALGVVLDLLARIEELEAALRARPDGRRSPHRWQHSVAKGDQSWT
jgi:DNA-binding transcriptional MerR regulator